LELNVAYSSDENYFQHMKISIMSLLDNNREFSKVNIYVLSNGITEDSLQNLNHTIKQLNYEAELTIIDFTKILQRIHTTIKFHLSSFGRLFLGECINKDRVLYLDCDSAVNGSFFELFQMKFGNSICAAVQDNVYVKYKKAIGLQKDDLYFNAGFLMIDLDKWRKEDLQTKALQMIERYNGNIPHNDQGVINAICYQRILRLHPKYNFQCPMFEYKPEQLRKLIPNYYSEKEILEARENPVFIHYTTGFSNRPWREPCFHIYKDVYRKYQNQTEYADQFENEPLNKNANMLKMAYQRLPFPIYRVFDNIVSEISYRKRRLK